MFLAINFRPPVPNCSSPAARVDPICRCPPAAAGFTACGARRHASCRVPDVLHILAKFTLPTTARTSRTASPGRVHAVDELPDFHLPRPHGHFGAARAAHPCAERSVPHTRHRLVHRLCGARQDCWCRLRRLRPQLHCLYPRTIPLPSEDELCIEMCTETGDLCKRAGCYGGSGGPFHILQGALWLDVAML